MFIFAKMSLIVFEAKGLCKNYSEIMSDYEQIYMKYSLVK